MKDNHITVVGPHLNQTTKGKGSLGDNLLGPTMRNSRLRTFLYAVVLGVMCFTVFLLSTTHSRLKYIEVANEKCQQQRDSLSAQLQVVYEHKNRLEKSLQQEKKDHRHTKEVFEKQLNELRVESEREKHTAESKYNSLLQEHETIQNKHSQVQEQLAELRNSFSQLEEEKKQLDSSLRVQFHSLQEKKDAEINKLHAQLNDILSEKDQLQQININTEWKIKQHTEELHLCQLQYQQLQEQLALQLQKHQLSPSKPSKKSEAEDDRVQAHGDDSPNEKVEDNNANRQKAKVDEVIQSVSKYDSAIQPKGNQQKVLERPNVHVPSNSNKVISNNIENNNLANEEKLSKNQAKDESLEVGNDQDFPVNPENRVLEPPAYHNHDVDIHSMGAGKVSFGEHQEVKSPEGEQEHLPQVQPPHSFDKAEEKNGFNQDEEIKGDDAKHQLEQPDFNSIKDVNKNEYARLQLQNSQEVNHNNIAPLQNAAIIGQDQGVLAKPPAEDGLMGQVQGNHNLDRQQRQGHDNKHHGWVEGLKRGPQVVNKRNVVPVGRRQDEDGDYAEDGDDDDDQGDDDQVMAGQGVRGKVFQDADFDDQENLEVDEKNVPNQDKEEGVMVAPK